MRSQRLKGEETTVVHSKRGNLLGIISIERANEMAVKCHVYVYRHTDQTLHTIGWRESYDAALGELRHYERAGD